MIVYAIVFLEGIVTFLSPCMLPMLPLYLSYFSAGTSDMRRTLRNACGFIAGFTSVFVLMGVFAAQAGRLLVRYSTAFNFITGGIVILFGLSYLGILGTIPLFKGPRLEMKAERLRNLGFFSSMLFGLIFAIGWTPCVGVFLGSALMLAASAGSRMQGIVMLLLFSMGLGIPFLFSALLLDRIKGTTDFIKRHYKIVNTIAGVLLLLLGVFMMTGRMSLLLSRLAY